MMGKIKSIITAPWRMLRRRSPEALLVLFLVSLAPLLYLGGRNLYSWALLAFSDTEDFFDLVARNPLTVLAGVGCFIGAAAVVVLVVRGWDNIWAVARKMILEALHRKVVLVLLLFFVILMPSLPFILETEGALKSQVQIVLTYSLALAEVLLAVLAVFVCTASICSEMTKKQVHITDTKPLSRWQFLFGKLLGVVLLCTVLLFLMSGAVYGIVGYMARDRGFEHLPEWEARERREDLRRVHEEVLAARRSVGPERPDVGDYVEQRIEEKKRLGEVAAPAELEEARGELKEEALRRRATAPARGRARFSFSGFEPGTENPVYLRAKPHKTNPDADHLCPGLWIFLRRERREGAEGWEIIGSVEQQLSPDAYQEIAIDPAVIDSTGSVHLIYENRCTSTGVYFDPDDGIELMQKVGGFAGNFYRSLIVILAHIVLLAALALMLGAMFSFPVASFCVGALLIIGLLGPWVAEHALDVHPPRAEGISQFLLFMLRNGIYTGLRAILAVMPQFGRFSPIGMVSDGRLVGFGYMLRATAVLAFLQGGLAMVLGAYFYWRRELARVIV